MTNLQKNFNLTKLLKKDMDADTNIPFLIVGLGNPGRKYQLNRHNVGFMLVSRIAERLEEKFSRMESRALVAKTTYGGHRVLLAKPQTYMNLSGQSVGPLVRYYKVPLDHLLVTYDDVDLPLGTIRMRLIGGSAGQKGMNSIIKNLGTQEFPRLRLGIGRPPGRMSAANYVLQDFSPEEFDFISITLDRATEAIMLYITEGLEEAMNRFNSNSEN
jgi:PTH1 family peptidyl-tRNA hydrolase